MYYFIKLETIISFIESATNLDLSNLSEYQQAILFLGGNIFCLICIIFMLSLTYKIIVRLTKFIF